MIPNPMRGEAAFGEHQLNITFNGWCALEAETGLKVPDLLLAMQDGLGFGDLRAWVMVFLDKPVSVDEAGDLIGALGVEATLAALTAGVEGFFALPAKEKKANPPKAA